MATLVEMADVIGLLTARVTVALCVRKEDQTYLPWTRGVAVFDESGELGTLEELEGRWRIPINSYRSRLDRARPVGEQAASLERFCEGPTVEETAVKNRPLDSNEQGKVLVFSLLLVPSVVFLFGLVPFIFLAFGVVMMRVNKDFSSIDTAVNYFKRYVGIAIAGGGAGLLYFGSLGLSGAHGDYDDIFYVSIDDGVIVSGVVIVVSVFYFISVQMLFYAPLKRHSEWVAANGIFSTKPTVNTNTGVGVEVDIVKGEGFRHYSVAGELIKWAKLRDDGLISDEEFNEAKARLLGRG